MKQTASSSFKKINDKKHFNSQRVSPEMKPLKVLKIKKKKKAMRASIAEWPNPKQSLPKQMMNTPYQ